MSAVEWSEDGKFLSFTNQGRRYRLELETLQRSELEQEKPAAADDEGGGPVRGRRGLGVTVVLFGDFTTRSAKLTQGVRFCKIERQAKPQGVASLHAIEHRIQMAGLLR